MRDLIK